MVIGTLRQESDYINRSIQEYVLAPVSTVDAERAEVTAERRAYTQFRDRLAGIGTVPASPTPPGTASRNSLVEPQSGKTERLRSALRKTIMSVDHCDELYDEPLVEHAAAELSPDMTVVFRRDTAPRFTEVLKRALTAAVSDAIDQRELLRDHLRTERDSLKASRQSLSDLLATCDGITVQTASRNRFETELAEIAQERQETIQRREPRSLTDGHDLYQYLYDDHEWTYPVLTAVARFRSTTNLRIYLIIEMA